MSEPVQRSEADQVRRILIAAAALIVPFAGWFLGVDRSWFVEGCPD